MAYKRLTDVECLNCREEPRVWVLSAGHVAVRMVAYGRGRAGADCYHCDALPINCAVHLAGGEVTGAFPNSPARWRSVMSHRALTATGCRQMGDECAAPVLALYGFNLQTF
jgi:hypothetical protein